MQSQDFSNNGKTHGKNTIAAVVLAGGAARRMGGIDKGLVAFGANTLVEAVIETLAPQVSEIVISANRNLQQYRELGYPVVTDKVDGYPGPLTGIAAVLSVIDSEFVVTAPCDSPFVPKNYVDKLYQAFQKNSKLMCAAAVSQGFKQPVFMMIRRETLVSIETFLASGKHKVREWLESMGVEWVEFEDLRSFANINTLRELEELVVQREKQQDVVMLEGNAKKGEGRT